MTAGRLAELLSLHGHRALVTGGCGAIGGATAALLRVAGAAVTALDLPGTEPPAGVELLAADLADRADQKRAAAAVAGADPPFDVLVHCAGVTSDAVLWKLSDEAWERVLRVNLDSAFALLRAAVPGLRRAGGGRVVLVASINGERGKFGQANYAASKAALIGLCRTAARELGAFGVRVNAVSPGWIDTPMTRRTPPEHRAAAERETALGRVGEPADVARAILFLCSPLGGHVTGQVLRVDGGQCTS